MRRSIALDGDDWTVEGFLGSEAADRAAARAGELDRPGAIPARVPGSILDDLRRAGQVPDPYAGRNSLAVEWVPERAWLYRRVLEVPELAAGERGWLAFDGLDYAGEVFWDGTLVGAHEGVFVPFEIDLSRRLRGRPAGRHELAVAVRPAPDSEAQLGRTSRVRVHKSRMGYGWDFCPRMINQGLWRSVRLEIADAVRIVDVWARPTLTPDLRAATVDVEVTFDAAEGARVAVEAVLEGGAAAGGIDARATTAGGAIASATTTLALAPGRSVATMRMAVVNPVLWWPNGLGSPVVHRLRVTVTEAARAGAGAEATEVAGAAGAVFDEASVPLGFRTIERAPNEGASPEARPWAWLVNGRRMYVKGWNWVPLDAQYGMPRPQRLRHLLRLAREANVNLLRVWGGGLIETPQFYDACDELGLLVWQEFAQSSSGTDSVPSADPDFVERMTAEATEIVRLRRNHPSLALWCGGNELEGEAGPLDDATPVLAALRGVVDRLDPGRAWLPTSPSGPRFANRLDTIEADPHGLHDVHGPWEHQGLRAQHELYDRGTSLFNSEFGVEGMTNRRTHEALIAPGERWPPTRANPVYRHLGDWWINEPLLQSAFDGRLTELEAMRRASQHLQADGLRYAIEANRRRAFRNGGSIPWQLNESYPNAWCTAAIDHRGDPKLAYFAVRRAYAPVVVAASFLSAAVGAADRFEATVWAWSDAEARTGAVVRARIVAIDGTEIASRSMSAELPADIPVRVGVIGGQAPFPPVFLLDLAISEAGGARIATNRYVCSGTSDLAPLLDVPAATISVDVSTEDGRWDVRVTHAGGPAALGVRLEDDRPIAVPGWAEVADGGFDLLPGEARSIAVRWAAGDDEAAVRVDGAGTPAERRLRLSAWNVADTVVAAP